MNIETNEGENENLIEVFRSGVHTDSAGVEREWTDSDIDNLVNTYNNQTEHEAPAVFGHPKTDDPAHGWVKKLKKVGSKVYAQFQQLSDSFKDSVNSGAYKKVSIAIYPNGLLRHVGFLGATPPAIKGMAAAKFKENEIYNEYTVSPDMAADNLPTKDSETPSIAINPTDYGSPDSVRAFISYYKEKSKGNEYLDAGLTNIENFFEDLANMLGDEPAAMAEELYAKYFKKINTNSNNEGVQMNEPIKEPEKAVEIPIEFADKVKTLETKLALIEERNKTLEKERMTADNEAFYSELLKDGKATPAQKAKVIAVLEMANDSGFTFSENETNISGIQLVKELLKSYEKQVEFKEVAKTGTKEVITKNENVPDNAIEDETDEYRNDIKNRVNSYMAKFREKHGKDIQYLDALDIVTSDKDKD